jgi:hypothetical protein
MNVKFVIITVNIVKTLHFVYNVKMAILFKIMFVYKNANKVFYEK